MSNLPLLQKKVALARQSGFSSLNEAYTARIFSSVREGASSKVKEINLREEEICEMSTSSTFQNSSFSVGGAGGISVSVMVSVWLIFGVSVLKEGLPCAEFCGVSETLWQEKMGTAKKQRDKI